MEKEQKCENGPTGVRDLNSQVTIPSGESPSACGSNRSIRAVVETAHKRTERRQTSDHFACSSNPPNVRDVHNSPSPPINEEEIECTKCEPAGVYGTKREIFQQTGSALLTDCFVSAVGVSQSGFNTLGEVVCDSVSTEGSGVAIRYEYGFNHVSNPGSLNSQDTFRDNSEYSALFASSGNSETIFRSYVISQEVPSEEIAGCKCILACGHGESNDLRPCRASAEHLESSVEYQRCGRNCFHKEKTNVPCDSCCPVSSGLSNLAAELEHQTATVSHRHVCLVHRLCPTAVLQEKRVLTPCETLPSSHAGADSSSQSCRYAVQWDSTTTKDSKNKVCEQNNVRDNIKTNSEKGACPVRSETCIGFLIPSLEARGCVYNTTSGSSGKLHESQGSTDLPSAGNTLQKDNRIEVSPAVRRSLIQISKSLQKKQSRVRIGNEVKAVRNKKETDARSKSVVKPRKYKLSYSKESSGNTTVKCDDRPAKKLGDSQSLLVLTSSCHGSPNGVRNTRKPSVVLRKSSSTSCCASHDKCKSHVADNKSSYVTHRPAVCITPGEIYSEQANSRAKQSESSGRNIEHRSNVLVGQKRKIVVRQTRASILRCTGQQQKIPEVTLTEDIQNSLPETSAIKELRDSTLYHSSSSRTRKSPRDGTPRSSKNVNRLNTRKPLISGRAMANAEIINKQQTTAKCKRSNENQEVKVRKEEKSSEIGIGHVFDKANIVNANVMLKDSSSAVVKTDVAKVSRPHNQPQALKAHKRLDSAGEVPPSVGGLHREKSTNDKKWKVNGGDKHVTSTIQAVSRNLLAQKTVADKSLARKLPPTSVPRQESSSSAPLTTTQPRSPRKKLNISGVSSVQVQKPLLSSPEEGANGTLQGSKDKVPTSLSTPTASDNKCETEVASDMDRKPCAKPTSTPKLLKSSAALPTKPAFVQSLQGATKRQPPYTSQKAAISSKSGRSKPSIHSSSSSFGVKSAAGLSPKRKHFSKETILSSSWQPSAIKAPTARIHLSTPLGQSAKNRPPSKLPETIKHQQSEQKEQKLNNIRYKCSKPNSASFCENVAHTTETAPTDECPCHVAEAAYSVDKSREDSSISLTRQQSTAARRSIPRYSKKLITDAGKCDTQTKQKESVLKSILINTSDRRLNGQADLLAVAFQKPANKEEEEDSLLYSGDSGGGQEVYSCPDRINSSHIEYKTGNGICGAVLALTGLHGEEVLEAIKMTGDSDLAENRALEAKEVSGGEGHGVLMLIKTPDKVAAKSKKTVKEYENIRVRKQSPNIPVTQSATSPALDQQVNNFQEDTHGVTKVGITKKNPVASKYSHSISSADCIKHPQVVHARLRLTRTTEPNKLQSEQTTGVEVGLEATKKLHKTAPKQTAVTRTHPSFKSRTTEKISPGKCRLQVKTVTSALETSTGSYSESTTSVLSELPSSSSSLSFSSCEQTTPEREDGKSLLFVNKTTTGRVHTASHGSGYGIRHTTTKAAAGGVISTYKPVRAPPHVINSKTRYTNVAAKKGSDDTITIKRETGNSQRGITQQKYPKRFQNDKKKTGKELCKTEMKKLMDVEKTKGNKQLVDEKVLSKLPVFNDLKNRVCREETSESVTKQEPLLQQPRKQILSNREFIGKHGNTDTHVGDVQVVIEAIDSSMTKATEIAKHRVQASATARVDLQESSACKSRDDRETLDVVFVQPPAVTENNSIPDALPVTGSSAPCVADAGAPVQTLPHVAQIDLADRPQIAAEASKCKHGVSRDTPIEDATAGELNASDIDSRERARSGSAQRKGAGSEEKGKKVEEKQTAISNRTRLQDSCLPCILPGDIRCCDNCKCALCVTSTLKCSNIQMESVEITNQVFRDVSTNGTYPHKNICEFRCLDIAQNTSSVSELNFQSTLGYELLMDNSSEEIRSQMCCHCVPMQRATGTVTTSVPETVRSGTASSAFALSAQVGHIAVSHGDSQSIKGVELACVQSVPGADVARRRDTHITHLAGDYLDVSSVDQVSETVHVNSVTDVTNDRVHTGPHSNTSLVSACVSDNAGSVPTEFPQICEPAHGRQLAHPVMVSIIGDFNKDQSVGTDNGIPNAMLESDPSKTIFRDVSADITCCISKNHDHLDCRGIFSEAGHFSHIENNATEHDVVGEMDVSFSKLNNDTAISLLSTDESFYSTPVGRSFNQDTHREDRSKDTEKRGSVFNNVDDSDIPEYFDDSDDKNDTESSGSSDSSYLSATSDILTASESTHERELASPSPEGRTSDELHTLIKLDSKCDPAHRSLNASFSGSRHYDSHKEDFINQRFILESLNSDAVSGNSTPIGCNRSQQSSETMPTKTSFYETITSVETRLEEGNTYQSKDMNIKENMALPSSGTHKCNDAQAPHDSPLQRSAVREHRGDSCSKLEPVSVLCDIPDAKSDLISSLGDVDSSTLDLAQDIAPGSNLVYTCSNASSVPEFSSLALSSVPQTTAEKRYHERNNSEDKMPSFLSMRSLSVERKKSGKNKSKSLPRSRSSFTVTSSSKKTSSVLSQNVASSITPPSILTPNLASPIAVSSTKISATVTDLIMITSNMTSATVMYSTAASSAMTSSPVINSYLSEAHPLKHGQQQHRQTSVVWCQSVSAQVHCSQLQESATERQTHTAETQLQESATERQTHTAETQSQESATERQTHTAETQLQESATERQTHTAETQLQESATERQTHTAETQSQESATERQTHTAETQLQESATERQTHTAETQSQESATERQTHTAETQLQESATERQTHTAETQSHESATERQTHTTKTVHKCKLGVPDCCSTVHTKQLTIGNKNESASPAYRKTTDDIVKQPPELGDVIDSNRHVNTPTSQDTNRQMTTPSFLETIASVITTVFKPEDEKVTRDTNKCTDDNSSHSCRKFDNQQHMQQFNSADEPENLTSCKQNISSSRGEMLRKSSGQGAHIEQHKLTSEKHPATDKAASQNRARAADPQPYLTAEMEQPLRSIETSYNFSNTPDSGVSDDRLPVSECTPTEFSIHSSYSLPVSECTPKEFSLHSSDRLPVSECTSTKFSLHSSDRLPVSECTATEFSLHSSDRLPASECTSTEFSLHSSDRFPVSECTSTEFSLHSSDRLPVSECTFTEFSPHPSAEALAFKTSLFESGYSSDIKSPEVKTPGKEFMDSQRQTVQTVSDNMILNDQHVNKITNSDSRSPGADLNCSIHSKTRETTLFDERIEATFKHSLQDLSPLPKVDGENVEKVASAAVRGGKISHFVSEQHGKLGERGAREEISRGGYLGDIPHELSTLCHDNVCKSVPKVTRLDLSSESSSNSLAHGGFSLDSTVSNSLNDVSSTYQEQHSQLAHKESFVDANTQLQIHAAPSTIAFSDTISTSECLKLDMHSEYKHASTNRFASTSANVHSKTHVSGLNFNSSEGLTEIQNEPAIVQADVTTNVDCDHLRAKHSCSEYLHCESAIRNCDIQEYQGCTCAYTPHVSADVSGNTSTNLDEDNHNVCSDLAMSQPRTSGSRVSASFKNLHRLVIGDYSSNTVNVKSNSFTVVSADHENGNSCIVNHNSTTELEHVSHDKYNIPLSNTCSQTSTHGRVGCVCSEDSVSARHDRVGCVCSEDSVSARHDRDVNRDFVKNVHACAFMAGAASSSLENGDNNLANNNLQVSYVYDMDLRLLCSQLKTNQSTDSDSTSTASKSAYVNHGALFQNDVCFIRDQTHLSHRRPLPLEPASLSSNYNQELVEAVSVPDETVSHVHLPGLIQKHNEEIINNVHEARTNPESTDSCLTSRNREAQQSTSLSDMSVNANSPGDCNSPVPYVVCDLTCEIGQHRKQQKSPNAFSKENVHYIETNIHTVSDKKLTSHPWLNKNIELYQNVSTNANYGTTENARVSTGTTQCEENSNSLMTGLSEGPGVVSLSVPIVDLNSCHDKKELPSSRRRSTTNRHEGLQKETSPFILEKVCELLSKVSANEQRNCLRPKSPLPHSDISRATISKNRSLTRDSKARAREERVIRKWKSMVEKSKAVRKQKSIAIFLSPGDNRLQLPPQISPTSLRKYKWERGDSGIWIKVYIDDENSLDNQVIQHLDKGRECHELDKQSTSINDSVDTSPTSSFKTSSAHPSKPASKEIEITVIEKSCASLSTCKRSTSYSEMKTSQQLSDNDLRFSEPLSNSEDTYNTGQEMVLPSTRLIKFEDHKEANQQPDGQKDGIFLMTHTMALDSKTEPCTSTSSGREHDLIASSPDIETTSSTCATEATRLEQNIGSLHQGHSNTKLATRSLDHSTSAGKLQHKSTTHLWPTVAESLKRFQKSRASVPSWEYFKREKTQGINYPSRKHNTSAIESNIQNGTLREEQVNYTSSLSSGSENKSSLITNICENCVKSERTLLASREESHSVRNDTSVSFVHNNSPFTLKEPSSTLSDSNNCTTTKAVSTTITGKCVRPQTLDPSRQISAMLPDSVASALRSVERSIKSSWTTPSASQRTLPSSPIITLPPDAISVRHSPHQTSATDTNTALIADPFNLKVNSSSNNSDHTDLSSSSDADNATPVAETVPPVKLAKSKPTPSLSQSEQKNKLQRQHDTLLPKAEYSQQKYLRQEMSQKTDSQSSLAISSCCIPESQATSSATSNSATTAAPPDPPVETTGQPGVRRHVPSTKLISVSVWDTHDGDKSLRGARRMWASEDKHELTEISEIEEAHTVHENIHGKSSNSQPEESLLLQVNDDCVERARASRSPVRVQAKQKPCQRRSLSLPSGGLSYGDVKILYKDGHFVLVDTSADRAAKTAGETTSALDDVFEDVELTDQSAKVYPQERNDDGYIKYSDSRVDDAVKKAQHTSLSFDSCDTGLSMRRFGSGGSIFYSLPRRKVRNQNAKSNDDAKMWRSQQSLVSQNETNRTSQKEEEEIADSCRLGPRLRRNNSFNEAMGSTVILTDVDRKRKNHKVRKHIDIDRLDHDDNEDHNYNSCQKEVVEDFTSRTSRAKGPGFIQRMLQKRKGTSSLSLSMSSLKPQNSDFSSSSLSLASSASSSSLQHTSPGRNDNRDSSVGRKISFRDFFKRKNSADLSTKKSAASEDCSSPPLAAFLSNDDIGATVPSTHTHTHSKMGTRHGSLINDDVFYVRENESNSSYQFRPRSATEYVPASSSQSSVYRSRSHDENNRSPIARQSDSASRRARSLSERTGRGGRILSEDQIFSGESSSEFDLSSPDPHNSDGTLTPRSTSPCATDLSGDQTLLASPVLSQTLPHVELHSVTSNPPRNRRTRSRCEETFQRACSAHGDSSRSIMTQRADHGEIISSNSNDSGIQKDFSVNSSAESIQTTAVKLRESHSPSPTLERPKSDSTVRWADWVEHAVQPWKVQHPEEANRQHKLPRATSETDGEDFNDSVSVNERNEDNMDQRNEVEKSSEGGIYTAGHRSNVSCLGHITNAKFAASGVISTSCCSTGSNAGEARLLTQSKESLMNLVELRRPVRDAASAKLAKLRRLSTPQPITVRTQKPRVKPPKAAHVPAVLMHAHSMPDNLDKLTRKKNFFSLIDSDCQSITSQQSICDNSSDESDYSMDYNAEKSLSTRSSHVMLAAIDQMLGNENSTLAEALWDHVTMDPDELAFRAGDLISVTDGADKHWWFGVLDGSEGWFPATFVRLRVNQDVVEEDLAFLLANDEALIISEARTMSEHAGKAMTSAGYQGMQQARANVVSEIINAEREYVKHLHDVVEGYVKHIRKRPEMFPIEKVTIIFSNIEDIYVFATELLTELEKSTNTDQPHLSELGHCFLNKVRKFEMYSDYCNNHSAACEELRELYRNKRYRIFFEACRLLQEMIEIPLEGFLLTPVQKICKYHLQLAELLKFTAPDHPDFHHVQAALEAMKKIAMLINERKRKMESVEKLAAWQLLVDGWEGPDILDDSSELIYSGELNKVNHAGWSQERNFFLFDHQLIYCKKDLLKKAGFCFKGRINMDTCEVINVTDGREPQYNVTVRNAWKLHDVHTDKWYLLVGKTTVAKQRWLKAFQDERKRVKDDTENNFNIPYHVKQAVITNFKQKNTIHKPKGKGHMSRANTAEVISSINRVNAIATLPRTKNRHKVNSEGTQDTSKKMKWFFFGKGKT